MECEIDIIKDFIKAYGRDVTLGNLLDSLLEMQEQEFEGGY